VAQALVPAAWRRFLAPERLPKGPPVLMRKPIKMHLAGIREDGDPVHAPSTSAEYITAA